MGHDSSPRLARLVPYLSSPPISQHQSLSYRAAMQIPIGWVVEAKSLVRWGLETAALPCQAQHYDTRLKLVELRNQMMKEKDRSCMVSKFTSRPRPSPTYEVRSDLIPSRFFEEDVCDVSSRSLTIETLRQHPEGHLHRFRRKRGGLATIMIPKYTHGGQRRPRKSLQSIARKREKTGTRGKTEKPRLRANPRT